MTDLCKQTVLVSEGADMYLTTGEAAKICGVKLNTIKNWIRSGDIIAIQTPGGHWRIPRVSFLQFMDKFTTPIVDENIDVQFSRKRILVIDDDLSAHELVTGALEAEGDDYELHSAHDGYSGLIEIGRLQPDLVVLDIMMPDISGLEIIHRLKAPDTPLINAKVIAITAAYDRRLVINRIKEASPEALLFKPLDITTFITTVHRILADHAGQNKIIQNRT